jgi:hypothetical protein
MIRQRGHRFAEKIMRLKNLPSMIHSIRIDPAPPPDRVARAEPYG